jgi:protein angel
MALFQPITSDPNSQDFFCVATTHLLFSPKRGDIKLAQLQYFLAEIDRFASKNSTEENFHPIIICGDFNAHPQSPLLNFLLNGQIQYNNYRRIEISGQIPQSTVGNRFSLPLPSNELLPPTFVTSDCRFPTARRSTLDENQRILQAFLNRTNSSRLTHNKRFSSAYDLNDLSKVTTRIGEESNLVDYILYSRSENDRHRLNLVGCYDLYDEDQMIDINLPNHQFSSDHFLLAAKFALKLHQKKTKKKK